MSSWRWRERCCCVANPKKRSRIENIRRHVRCSLSAFSPKCGREFRFGRLGTCCKSTNACTSFIDVEYLLYSVVGVRCSEDWQPVLSPLFSTCNNPVALTAVLPQPLYMSANYWISRVLDCTKIPRCTAHKPIALSHFEWMFSTVLFQLIPFAFAKARSCEKRVLRTLRSTEHPWRERGKHFLSAELWVNECSKAWVVKLTYAEGEGERYDSRVQPVHWWAVIM